ncbi:hypothetical protein B0A49_01680 [Cryomyces minteri]|uniref:Myb-like domain-containing protein n=1 Tax=Cryomyces minteri TaxID=331657 RepID=A0A4U0XKW9_9PEZI|nr:hypothetical protein B0A49_01680 [Cryomyces minteri]
MNVFLRSLTSYMDGDSCTVSAGHGTIIGTWLNSKYTGLASVDEDPVSQTPERGEPAGTERSHHDVSPPDDDLERQVSQVSEGDLSAVSDTSEKTSFSILEIAELDRDVMLEILPDLHQASSGLLRIIAPDQQPVQDSHAIIEELKVKDSKTSKILKLRLATLATHVQNFTSQDYLRPDLILRCLLKAGSVKELGSQAWRPDEVFYKANLASFARAIISMDRESDDAWNALNSADTDFPNAFLSAFMQSDPGTTNLSTGGSALLEQTFQLGLEIRTQMVVVLLMARRNEDVDKILAQVFCDLPVDKELTTQEYKDALEDGILRGWDTDGLTLDDKQESREFVVAVARRVKTIRQFFGDGLESTKPEVAVGIGELQEKFPWPDFQIKVIEWTRRRNREIDSQIKNKGGIDRVSELLAKEIELRQDHSTNEAAEKEGSTTGGRAALRTAQSVQRSHATPEAALRTAENGQIGTAGPVGKFSLPVSEGWMRLAKKRHSSIRTKTSPEAPEASGRRETEPRLEDGDWRPPVEDETTEQEPATRTAPRSTADRLAQARQIERNQNKENLRRNQNSSAADTGAAFIDPYRKRPAFVDPQPGAARIGFDDSGSSQIQTQRRQGRSPKRARVEEEEVDVSEDEGFQVDDRSVDAEQRRQAASAGRQSRIVPDVTSPPKRIRVAEGIAAERRHVPRRETSVSDLEEEVPSTAASRYRTINKAAKALTGTRDLDLPYVPQHRRAWTDEEVNALLNLIAEYGPRYSMIKKIDTDGDNVLVDRDQTALRNKAENMKFDFIKSGQAGDTGMGLPTNFHLVPLKRRQLEQLQKFGIDLEQAAILNV